MKDLASRTVLVTGAASGIGRETALAFARQGSTLLLVDIHDRGLISIESEIRRMGTDCTSFQVDVSNPEQVDIMANTVIENYGGLDILINNAGVFCWADFVDTELEDWEWLMGVNLWGPIHTIRAFLPGMIERKRGHIVNVASGGGLLTLPGLSAYCASKFGLVGLSEALQHEVQEHNIVVTAVCPGSTRTPIIENIRVRGLDRERLERVAFPITNRYPAVRTADIIVSAVMRDRRLVITTLQMKLMYGVKRISPALYRLMVRPLTRFFYSRFR